MDLETNQLSKLTDTPHTRLNKFTIQDPHRRWPDTDHTMNPQVGVEKSVHILEENSPQIFRTGVSCKCLTIKVADRPLGNSENMRQNKTAVKRGQLIAAEATFCLRES